jgi:hypothetical protein
MPDMDVAPSEVLMMLGGDEFTEPVPDPPARAGERRPAAPPPPREAAADDDDDDAARPKPPAEQPATRPPPRKKPAASAPPRKKPAASAPPQPPAEELAARPAPRKKPAASAPPQPPPDAAPRGVPSWSRPPLDVGKHPTRNAAAKARASETARTLKKSDIAQFMHLTVAEAAAHFGLGRTRFKSVCRREGIHEWPRPTRIIRRPNGVKRKGAAANEDVAPVKQSKYIGVLWHGDRWHAQITHQQYTEYLGAFTKEQGEEEAARTFDAAVRKKRKTLKHSGVDMQSRWTLNFATPEDVEEDRRIERECIQQLNLGGMSDEDEDEDQDEDGGKNDSEEDDHDQPPRRPPEQKRKRARKGAAQPPQRQRQRVQQPPEPPREQCERQPPEPQEQQQPPPEPQEQEEEEEEPAQKEKEQQAHKEKQKHQAEQPWADGEMDEYVPGVQALAFVAQRGTAAATAASDINTV